jgi:hypothetical protein
MDDESSDFSDYLDSVTRGVGTIASALNRPRAPANPNVPRKPEWLPWAIGGGVVVVLLVIVLAVTGRR